MCMCFLRRFQLYGNGTTSAASPMIYPGQPWPILASTLLSIGAYSASLAWMSRNGSRSTLVGKFIGLAGCSSSAVSSLLDGQSAAIVALVVHLQMRYRGPEILHSPCTSLSLVGHSRQPHA